MANAGRYERLTKELSQQSDSTSQLSERLLAKFAPTGHWLLPLIATAFAYRQVGSFDLIGDARFLILDNTFLRSLDQLWANLTHDYFWSSSGAGIPYWRPFTKAAWLIERQLFGTNPGGLHLVQLGWHLLAVAGVYALGRTASLSRWASSLAALALGLHVAAIEPVCLVMARSDVVVLAAMLWSVVGWLRWRDRARWSYLGLHLLATIFALASKEVAVTLTPILALWIVSDGDRRLVWRRHALALLPAVVLTVAYLIARHAILDELPTPALEFSRLVAGGAAYLQHVTPLRLESALRYVPWAETTSLAFIIKSGITWLVFGVIVVICWRGHQKALALIGWGLLVLAPVLLGKVVHVPGAEGKIALADRWLYAAIAPLILCIATLLDRLDRPLLRRVAAGGVLLWATMSLVVSGPARAAYAGERSFVAIELRNQALIPPAFRSPLDRCRAADLRLVVALQSKAAPAAARQRLVVRARELLKRCGPSPTRLFNLASTLVRAEDYRHAWPAIEKALASPSPRALAQLHFLAGKTLLRLRRPRGALAHFIQAEKRGLRSCNLYVERAEAHLMVRQNRKAARSLETAARCHPEPGGVLLTAAYWWIQAGDAGRGRQLVERAAKLRLDGPARKRLDELRRRLATRRHRKRDDQNE